MVLEGIRSFFASRMTPQQDASGPDPVAIAACALLLEIAHADAVFGPEERERIVRHVRDDFGISEDDVRDVIRLADEERRESIDLYQFTRLVRESFTHEQRLRLIEAIWGVVYSDGALSALESQLARRIAELLGFQHPEVQAARERVADRRAAPSDET